MAANIDLYWSFRSPYCYLSAPGALEVEKRFDVEISLRPVLPLALRNSSFFAPENMRKIKYLQLDYPRRAELLGMKPGWPSPDPIVQDLQTMKIAEEQPYIYRLTYLGVEAQRQGCGLPFAFEVSQLLFSGGKGWDQGDRLAKAAARAGLSLNEMDAAITDGRGYREQVDANQEALESVGGWGVPTFVYQKEPFFGQDRIDSLCFRLEKDNL